MRNVDARPALRHGGHPLTTLATFDRLHDGDYPNGVLCDTCNTFGDVYVIDGGVYIDMSHKDIHGLLDDER